MARTRGRKITSRLQLLLACLLGLAPGTSLQLDDLMGLLDESGTGSGAGSSAHTPMDCSKLDEALVNRFEWNARSPSRRLERFGRAPTRVFVHSTSLFFREAATNRAVSECQRDGNKCAAYLRQVQAHHQFDNKWPDIAYNYLVAHDGIIYEGLGPTSQGFHTANYNNESLGVALIGHYESTAPDRRLEQALSELLACLVDLNHLDRDYALHGHRDARCTSCPGRAAYKRLRTMSHFRPGPLARSTCPAAEGGESAQPPSPPLARKRRAAQQEQEQQHQQVQVSAQNTLYVNRERHPWTAAIGKSQEKQLIVVNMPPAPSSVSAGLQQQVAPQPAFYLLTSSKSKAPTLVVLNSPPAQSLGSGAGAGSSGGGSSGSGGGASGQSERDGGDLNSGGGGGGGGASTSSSSSSGQGGGGQSAGGPATGSRGAGSSSSGAGRTTGSERGEASSRSSRSSQGGAPSPSSGSQSATRRSSPEADGGPNRAEMESEYVQQSGGSARELPPGGAGKP